MRTVRVATAPSGGFRQTIRIGGHEIVADEAAAVGGDDAGPAPHELLLAGLGACTSMTLAVYARRKGWKLESVTVELEAAHVDGIFQIERRVALTGPLSAEERRRLLEIADKCPVHKTLVGTIAIKSALMD